MATVLGASRPLIAEPAEYPFESLWHQVMEENMHTIRLGFACALAGTLTAFSAASLCAAPLPTNLTAMKSLVADNSIQVRWGGWRGGGWGYRGGWGRGWSWGAGALAGALVGGAIASSAYGYYGAPYYGGYYAGYSNYPAYVDYGPWQAIQEPGIARFYRPYGPWGYW